jgi:hypothetical protein
MKQALGGLQSLNKPAPVIIKSISAKQRPRRPA